MMPVRAFASLFGVPPSDIDPVRSSTTMMSSGFAPHGWQAVALAPTFIEVMPKTRAKAVSSPGGGVFAGIGQFRALSRQLGRPASRW